MEIKVEIIKQHLQVLETMTYNAHGYGGGWSVEVPSLLYILPGMAEIIEKPLV